MKMNYIFMSLLMLLGTWTMAQEAPFVVEVLQDGKVLKEEAQRVSLSKRSFQIGISGKVDQGVLVGITLDKSVYERAMSKQGFEEGWFAQTGMAEGFFNEDQSLFISNEAPSYWYYSADDDHRFDAHPKPRRQGQRFHARRTVSYVSFLEPFTMVEVAQLRTPLFMVFYTKDHESDSITWISGRVLQWQDEE